MSKFDELVRALLKEKDKLCERYPHLHFNVLVFDLNNASLLFYKKGTNLPGGAMGASFRDDEVWNVEERVGLVVEAIDDFVKRDPRAAA